MVAVFLIYTTTKVLAVKLKQVHERGDYDFDEILNDQNARLELLFKVETCAG